MESYGAWGPSTTTFFNAIAEGHFGKLGKGAISKFKWDLAARVSVALQRGVADTLLSVQSAFTLRGKQAAAGVV